jgi:hypothetical protein
MITNVFISPGKESIVIEIDGGDGGLYHYEDGYTEVEELSDLVGDWNTLAIRKPGGRHEPISS